MIKSGSQEKQSGGYYLIYWYMHVHSICRIDVFWRVSNILGCFESFGSDLIFWRYFESFARGLKSFGVFRIFWGCFESFGMFQILICVIWMFREWFECFGCFGLTVALWFGYWGFLWSLRCIYFLRYVLHIWATV